MIINLIEQLKRHEGFESDYYQCTANKRTIGYGRNVDNNPFSTKELEMLGRDDFTNEPMTEEEAEQLLVNDVKETIELIKDHLPWNELNPARQGVCANMAFQMGVSGLFKFKNMIRSLHDCFYEKAANEMLNSRWAKQTTNRANELAIQMDSGEWQ